MAVKISGIYRIVNIFNNKCYVGQSIDIFKRWNEHKRLLRKNIHHAVGLQRAWNKYENFVFVFEILEKINIEESAKFFIIREQHWMDFYKSYGCTGYNSSPSAGSCLGFKQTFETRLKQSLQRKGRKDTIETRRRKSESLKGRIIPKEHLDFITKRAIEVNTGSIRSEEAKMKAKATRFKNGYTPSLETREKQRQAKLGKKASEEARENMRKSHIGLKGTPHTEKTKIIMRQLKIGKPLKPEHVAAATAARQAVDIALREKGLPDSHAKKVATIKANDELRKFQGLPTSADKKRETMLKKNALKRENAALALDLLFFLIRDTLIA